MKALAPTSAARQRLQEINGWVRAALDGLGHAARDSDLSVPWEWTWYKQAVLFEARDVERSNRGETQDLVLDAVKRALLEGISGVRVRDGDSSWGWRVLGTKDLSAEGKVDNQGVPLWEPSMPKYACWIVWQGPKPPTWPHMMHMGQAENPLSYPVGHAPTWEN